MRACKCPNCGSNLNFDDDKREYIFCQYCGAKIDLMDQRTVHTEHIVDDAKIKNAESIHRIVNIFASPFEDYRKKKQEKEAQEAREAKEAAEAAEAFETACIVGLAWCINFIKHHKEESIAALVAIALLVSLAFASSQSDARKKAIQADLAASSHIAMGEVQYPEDAYTSGDYRNTYKKLKDAGFTNITLDPAEDLIFGFLETENDIIEITVDGAPSFEMGEWYPANIPIVISYHSFIGSASSKIEEVKDTVAQKAQEVIDSASNKVQNATTPKTQGQLTASTTPASKSKELPVTTKNTVESFSYMYAFLHTGDSDSHHYWLLDIQDHVACLINTYSSEAYLFQLPSDNFNAGVSLDFSSISFVLHSNTLSSGLSVKYGTDANYFFSASTVSNALSDLNSVQSFYDLRSVNILSDVPTEGIRSNGAVSVSTKPATPPTASSPAKPEPSLNYTPAHKDTDYDAAYALRSSSYTNYYLISYSDKIVRSFSYGNGSKEAYVGHITCGSKSDGFTVHYNYDNGWDETIQIDGVYLTLTDSYGNSFVYTVSPLSPVRDIYKSNNYHDISEN